MDEALKFITVWFVVQPGLVCAKDGGRIAYRVVDADSRPPEAQAYEIAAGDLRMLEWHRLHPDDWLRMPGSGIAFPEKLRPKKKPDYYWDRIECLLTKVEA